MWNQTTTIWHQEPSTKYQVEQKKDTNSKPSDMTGKWGLSCRRRRHQKRGSGWWERRQVRQSLISLLSTNTCSWCSSYCCLPSGARPLPPPICTTWCLRGPTGWLSLVPISWQHLWAVHWLSEPCCANLHEILALLWQQFSCTRVEVLEPSKRSNHQKKARGNIWTGKTSQPEKKNETNNR